VANFRRLRVTNVTTGKSFWCFEDDVQIEIDGDGLVSITTPEIGSREFLLRRDDLERMGVDGD
jgi:hypothetical protein